MWQKIKKIGAIVIIIILLPYILTFFLNRESIQDEKKSLLDEYCIRRLAKEVSSDYHETMLKVQAILVRTTVYKEINELTKDNVEIFLQDNSPLDLSWKQTLETVWEETDGQVVMYENELALVPFHQISNGQTRSGKEVLGSDEYPYLQIVDCSKDIGADNQMQTKVLDLSGVSVVKKDSAGYVLEVKADEEICNGEEFRGAYALASSSFELQEFDNKTRVITRGVGHGLGLSQFTANEMAKAGKTYQEILEYFFPKTEIKEVAEILWNTE